MNIENCSNIDLKVQKQVDTKTDISQLILCGKIMSACMNYAYYSTILIYWVDVQSTVQSIKVK